MSKLESLASDLERLIEKKIVVGIYGEEASRPHPEADGATVGEIAMYNEFGSLEQNREPRPFMRIGAELSKRDAAKHVAAMLIQIVRQGGVMSPHHAMDELRREVLATFLENFDRANNWAAPLKPSTIAEKGHSQPLYDSGTMRHAIRAKVE